MPTILVVDDDLAICALLEDALMEDGYRVQTAHNGQQALRILALITVDLVLSDVMMPVMDGFVLCRQLAALPATATTPVILISAGSVDAIPAACSHVMVVPKPFQILALLLVVERTLAHTQATAGNATPPRC